jgi:predicted alpha/beta hydrolase
LVRQLNDHKGGVDLQELRGGGLKSLALVAGELLARGHARSGDVCEIRGYCGSGAKMAKVLRDFACEYADQTVTDYGAFVEAIKSGRVKVDQQHKEPGASRSAGGGK